MQQPPEQDQGAMSPEQGGVPPSGGPTTPGAAPNAQDAQAPQQPSPDATPSRPSAMAPDQQQWMTFASVKGLPIVDLTTGTRVGDVGDLILSPTYRYVEAFTTAGGAFHHDKTFPARGSTMGKHAVTLPRGAMEGWDMRGLDQMPRASALIGMKLLTETGRIVGEIRGLYLDPLSGALMALEIHTPEHSILDRLRRRETHTFPANAVTQYGRDAVIIQDALARQYLGEHE